MLWKQQLPELPNNRCLAISRMLSLQKKFEKSPLLKEKYFQTTNEFIKDGHASILSKAKAEKESTKIINYIPHQAVTNVSKPGKIRVVFDAGAKYKNKSLNENLQKGPDIEKMFHQVLVREQDREALQFVWYTNKKEQFRDIQMNVHPFGKVDSPCCCLWALKKTSTDSITNIIVRAKEAITENFYMDDYLDSFNTQSEAMEISQQVMVALKEGGFRLTKWISKDRQILDTLPLSEISAAPVNLDLDDTIIERALGIL